MYNIYNINKIMLITRISLISFSIHVESLHVTIEIMRKERPYEPDGAMANDGGYIYNYTADVSSTIVNQQTNIMRILRTSLIRYSII